MRTLNLGILAHVDAGKTTLTERLLFEAGAIQRIGSVDAGTTQTDTLDLERERGITIKSAVASFAIDDLAVNILDTPGHPDFIAEVERVLRVLDGAILVISAVEGVQPQTPLLYRALERLGVPTLLFLNKLDRRGADADRTLDAISKRLTPAVVPMARAIGAGSSAVSIDPAGAGDPGHRATLAERLADHDDRLLAAYVEQGDAIPYPTLRRSLATQARSGLVHPAFLGSAITGLGVAEILRAIPELLPEAGGDPAAELAGRVFKIERSPAGDRVAYARLIAGTLHPRDRIRYGEEHDGRVTSLAAFTGGPAGSVMEASAGQIVKIGGLAGIRVGDALGAAVIGEEAQQFPPPALESVVVPAKPAERGRLRAALNDLAEQDPLINVRQDDERGEISVSLYGEVQKEVIGQTLARDYGVEAWFRETTTVCIERPAGPGEAFAILRAATHSNITGRSSPTSDNPFVATMGLRLEPGKPDSGLQFRLDVDAKLVPLHIFHTVAQFEAQMARYVADALAEGVHGWQVTDCAVTMVDCGYMAVVTSAGDFRKLTPLVLAAALREAGVVVCEPMTAVRIEAPVESGRGIAGVIVSTGGRILGQHAAGERTTVVAMLQAGRVHEVQNRLPGLTGGEGVLDSSFGGYHPVTAETPPSRRRTRPDPFSRDRYLAAVGRTA